MMKHRVNVYRHARGYAMLAMIATIGMAATIAIAGLSATIGRNQTTQTTAAALAQAKQALISRAASDANHPGSLPCPDAVTNIAGNNVPNDGVADLLAGPACPSMIGRLPWRTLGLPDLRDADGERLWYFVAPAYQDSSAKIINPGTAGQITGYDCANQEAASRTWPCDNPRAIGTAWVAVVFSPGKAFGAQVRDAAHAGDYAQYLESFNPADPYRLRVAANAESNDRLATISPDDIFAIAQRRIANELQAVLTKYFAATAAQGSASMPWPAAACTSAVRCAASPLTAPLPAIVRGYLPSDDSQLNQIMAAQNMTWFDHNQWRNTLTYLLDANCADGGNASQCGNAFAASERTQFDANTVLVGGSAGAMAVNTRAALAFGGVSGAQKTRLLIAIQ